MSVLEEVLVTEVNGWLDRQTVCGESSSEDPCSPRDYMEVCSYTRETS